MATGEAGGNVITPRQHTEFAADAASRTDQIVRIAQTLIGAASPNPPGDTTAVAHIAGDLLRAAVPSAEIEFHQFEPGILNLVARVRGAAPGRRLVFNGHLDTFPLGDGWSVDPLGGAILDGRLYGRGAADMKGGIAASLVALACLADWRHVWHGEAVLTLAGDEETMGTAGTHDLMRQVPHATGDAAIIGDAGSPSVLRFGEKGFLWIELAAVGTPAHGAHVHRGTNAIDRLRAALDSLVALRNLRPTPPAAVTAAISAAKSISEPLSGAGEAAVLQQVTVNIGRIEGGTSTNLVPASARASADIRVPVGLTTAEVLAPLQSALAGMEGVSWRVLRQVEPNYTDPAAELISLTTRAATHLLGAPPAVNMRVGASDARLFRMAGIPAVVYGPTPFNMGGPDEHVLVSELDIVARVHATTAFAFLT